MRISSNKLQNRSGVSRFVVDRSEFAVTAAYSEKLNLSPSPDDSVTL